MERRKEPLATEIAQQGACRQLGIDALRIMYPDPENDVAVAMARSVCDSCVITELCRDTAIKNKEPDGMWGGLMPAERHTVARKRQRNRNGHQA